MSACDAVIAALSSGRALSTEEAAHARDCPACQALLRAEAALPSLRGSEAPVMAPVVQQAVQATRPVRPYSVGRRMVVPVVMYAVLGVLMALRAPPSSAVGWMLAAIWMALGMLGVMLVLHRGRSGVGVPVQWQWLGAAVTWVAFEGLVLLEADFALAPGGAAWWHQGGHCVASGAAVSALVGAGVMGVGARTALVSPVAAGAAGGMAAGFAGILMLHFLCPLDEALHLVIAHGLVLVLAGVGGMIVGRRVLAV